MMNYICLGSSLNHITFTGMSSNNMAHLGRYSALFSKGYS